MKTLLVGTLLLLGITHKAAAIGHPHNLFAARKHPSAKTAYATGQNPNLSKPANWSDGAPARPGLLMRCLLKLGSL